MIARIGLGELLWSLLVIYLMVMYVIIVFTVYVDIFRSDDLSGAKKAIWVLGLLFFPIISLRCISSLGGTVLACVNWPARRIRRAPAVAQYRRRPPPLPSSALPSNYSMQAPSAPRSSSRSRRGFWPKPCCSPRHPLPLPSGVGEGRRGEARRSVSRLRRRALRGQVQRRRPWRCATLPSTSRRPDPWRWHR